MGGEASSQLGAMLGAMATLVVGMLAVSLGAMPTLIVGMLAVSLRSLGKHGTRPWQAWHPAPVSLSLTED